MSNSSAWKEVDGMAGARAEEPPTRQINMNRLGEALAAQGPDSVDLLFVYNSNPMMTIPNQERVRAGLEREDLFTVVFDPVMTDTARYADVVLPAATFLERTELSRGYGAFVLQVADAVIAPVGEARPNHEVFASLCRRAGVAVPGDPETAAELTAALLEKSPRSAELHERLGADRIAFAPEGLAPVQFVDVFPADRGPQGPPGSGGPGPRGARRALRLPAGPGDRAVSPGAHLARDGPHDQQHAGRVAARPGPARDAPRRRRWSAASPTECGCASSTRSAKCAAPSG